MGQAPKDSKKKRVTVHCAEEGCNQTSRGYDIDRTYDQDMNPVYAVYYECPLGHKFVSEYERSILDDAEKFEPDVLEAV